MSDIHGCYEEYIELLKKIKFSDRDELYVLGDVVDRGPAPIKVLQDMMLRVNVFPIIGNHDLVALLMLRKFSEEVTEENAESYLSDDDIEEYMQWIQEGGQTTVEEYLKLNQEEREDILDYLEEFFAYHEINRNGKRYILVHATLNNFDENKELEDYNLQDLLFYRMDYSKRYFSDENTYIISGHTPTSIIREDKKPLVYEEKGHIGIDCGCVFGGKLAAYCLDTGETHYVEARK